jgi:hypothetical protein
MLNILRRLSLCAVGGMAAFLAMGTAADAEILTNVIKNAQPVSIETKPLLSLEDVGKIFTASADKFLYWCTENGDTSISCLDVDGLATGKIAKLTLSRTHIDILAVNQGMGMSLDTAEIAGVEVYQFPTMHEMYQYGVRIVAKPGKDTPKAYWLRALNADTGPGLGQCVPVSARPDLC